MKGTKYFIKGKFNSQKFDEDFPVLEKRINMNESDAEPIYKIENRDEFLDQLYVLQESKYVCPKLELIELYHDVEVYISSSPHHAKKSAFLDRIDENSPKTLKEISIQYGVSQSNIRQRIKWFQRRIIEFLECQSR